MPETPAEGDDAELTEGVAGEAEEQVEEDALDAYVEGNGTVFQLYIGTGGRLKANYPERRFGGGYQDGSISYHVDTEGNTPKNSAADILNDLRSWTEPVHWGYKYARVEYQAQGSETWVEVKAGSNPTPLPSSETQEAAKLRVVFEAKQYDLLINNAAAPAQLELAVHHHEDSTLSDIRPKQGSITLQLKAKKNGDALPTAAELDATPITIEPVHSAAEEERPAVLGAMTTVSGQACTWSFSAEAVKAGTDKIAFTVAAGEGTERVVLGEAEIGIRAVQYDRLKVLLAFGDGTLPAGSKDYIYVPTDAEGKVSGAALKEALEALSLTPPAGKEFVYFTAGGSYIYEGADYAAVSTGGVITAGAEYKNITYTVTYHVYLGKTEMTVVEMNEAVLFPQSPVQDYTAEDLTSGVSLADLSEKGIEGYDSFDGWYTNRRFTGTPISKLTSENTTPGHLHLYGRFMPSRYDITYKFYVYNSGNSGTVREITSGVINPNSKTSYTAADATYVIKDPSYGSYRFEGWYEAVTVSGGIISPLGDKIENPKIGQGDTGAKTFIGVFSNPGIDFIFFENSIVKLQAPAVGTVAGVSYQEVMVYGELPEGESVVFSSVNEKVAKAEAAPAEGKPHRVKITAVSAGETTVTARAGGKTATVGVVVQAAPVKAPARIALYQGAAKPENELEKDPENIGEYMPLVVEDTGSGKTVKLSAKVLAEDGKDATVQDVTWEVLDAREWRYTPKNKFSKPVQQSIDWMRSPQIGADGTLTIPAQSWNAVITVRASSGADADVSRTLTVLVDRYYNVTVTDAESGQTQTVLIRSGANYFEEGTLFLRNADGSRSDQTTTIDPDAVWLWSRPGVAVESRLAQVLDDGWLEAWWIDVSKYADYIADSASGLLPLYGHIWDSDLTLTSGLLKAVAVSYGNASKYTGYDASGVTSPSGLLRISNDLAIGYCSTAQAVNLTGWNLAPSLFGYTFAGFVDAEGKPVSEIAKGQGGVISLSARFRKDAEQFGFAGEDFNASQVLKNSKTLNAKAVMAPANAETDGQNNGDYKIVYESSDPDKASVDDKGMVTALADEGEVTVTARLVATDGSEESPVWPAPLVCHVQLKSADYTGEGVLAADSVVIADIGPETYAWPAAAVQSGETVLPESLTLSAQVLSNEDGEGGKKPATDQNILWTVTTEMWSYWDETWAVVPVQYSPVTLNGNVAEFDSGSLTGNWRVTFTATAASTSAASEPVSASKTIKINRYYRVTIDPAGGVLDSSFQREQWRRQGTAFNTVFPTAGQIEKPGYQLRSGRPWVPEFHFGEGMSGAGEVPTEWEDFLCVDTTLTAAWEIAKGVSVKFFTKKEGGSNAYNIYGDVVPFGQVIPEADIERAESAVLQKLAQETGLPVVFKEWRNCENEEVIDFATFQMGSVLNLEVYAVTETLAPDAGTAVEAFRKTFGNGIVIVTNAYTADTLVKSINLNEFATTTIAGQNWSFAEDNATKKKVSAYAKKGVTELPVEFTSMEKTGTVTVPVRFVTVTGLTAVNEGGRYELGDTLEDLTTPGTDHLYFLPVVSGASYDSDSAVKTAVDKALADTETSGAQNTKKPVNALVYDPENDCFTVATVPAQATDISFTYSVTFADAKAVKGKASVTVAPAGIVFEAFTPENLDDDDSYYERIKTEADAAFAKNLKKGEKAQIKGEIFVPAGVTAAKKVKVTSDNTKIVKPLKASVNINTDNTFRIDLQAGGTYGTAVLTLTADDKAKTTARVCVSVYPDAFSLSTDKATLNLLATTGQEITVIPAYNESVQAADGIGTVAVQSVTVTDKGTKKKNTLSEEVLKGYFTVVRRDYDTVELKLAGSAMTDVAGLQTGKYQVQLSESGKAIGKPLTVTVTEKQPKVVVKQAEALNLKMPWHAVGVSATVDGAKASAVYNVEWGGPFLVGGDYVRVNNAFSSVTAADAKKAVAVFVSAEGYRTDAVRTSFKVRVTEKLPVLKAAAVTMVPGIKESARLSFTLDGKPVPDDELSGATVTLSGALDQHYRVTTVTEYVYVHPFHPPVELNLPVLTAKGSPKAAKGKVQVNLGGITYSADLSVQVQNVDKVKVKPAKAKVTLNGNAPEDMVFVPVGITGLDSLPAGSLVLALHVEAEKGSDAIEVKPSGNAMSGQALEVGWKSGETRPLKGNYTYRVTGQVKEPVTGAVLYETPAVKLTVQATGTALKKTVTISQKGTIDLMKDGSAITLTVKVKGLNTFTHQVLGYNLELAGKDASLFKASLSGSNQISIYPVKPASSYLTGRKYDVRIASLSILHDDGGMTLVRDIDKKVNVVLKQSKPKVTLTPVKGTISGTANAKGNTMELAFAASVPGGSAIIKSVSLVYDKSVGDALQLQKVDFDSDQQSGTLELKQTKMLKKGAKYNVKLLVVFENQAANAKETIVNFKVTVK